MRNVLIISPHFPPVNAPDHQRVRMSLPYLKEFGWTAAVLAVSPEEIEGATLDPLLESAVPTDVPVHRVRAVPAAVMRLSGLGNLALRALPHLWKVGNELLLQSRKSKGESRSDGKTNGFDLVFFSTTQFPVMILGPIWKRKFGVPYVVDFQDPWLDDYYERTGTVPPGGKARYRLSRILAGKLEPRVMRDVSQVISVSPAYVQTLQGRYPHLHSDHFTVLPFGAPERDFDLLQSANVQQRIFDSADGKQHWLYVGRAGDDMAAALHVLFSAIEAQRAGNPDEWRKIRLHFVGTSYAPEGRAATTVEPIAERCGVADMVDERTSRVPYFEALQALKEADALLVIGSDSPSYSASKLYPYMLARRPMLSVLHEQSPAVEILRKCRAGEVVTFDPASPDASRAAMVAALQATKDKVESREAKVMDGEDQTEVDWAEFQQYTAREMTRRMCEVFDRAVETR